MSFGRKQEWYDGGGIEVAVCLMIDLKLSHWP